MSYFSAIIEPTKQMLEKLLGDPNFREKITYKRYVGQHFDTVLGYNVDTTIDTALYAVRMKHTRASVKVAQSDVEVGDMLFLFAKDSFPADVSLKDAVVDANGNVLGIKGLDPVFGIAVIVTVSDNK